MYVYFCDMFLGGWKDTEIDERRSRGEGKRMGKKDGEWEYEEVSERGRKDKIGCMYELHCIDAANEWIIESPSFWNSSLALSLIT